jgi:hypothetical protein
MSSSFISTLKALKRTFPSRTFLRHREERSFIPASVRSARWTSIDPVGRPVTRVETARKVLDPKTVPSNLLMKQTFTDDEL